MPTALPYLATADQSITPPAGYSKRKRDDGPETVDDDLSDKPPLIELQRLFLPSDLPPNIRAMCHAGLEDIERQLREAQCCTVLGQVQTRLYIKSGLVTYKQRYALHQGMNTRMREELRQNDLKAKLHQAKYNAARVALNNLCGADKGVSEWKEMKDADVRCMQDPEQEEKRAEWERRRQEKRKTTLEQRNTENVDGPGLGEGS